MKGLKIPRHIDQLVEIANAGGGLRLDASKRPVEHLVRLAEAALLGGGTIYLRGIDAHSLEHLVAIARAGSGHVVLEIDDQNPDHPH